MLARTTQMMPILAKHAWLKEPTVLRRGSGKENLWNHQNTSLLFSLVWGQCPDTVHTKMEVQTKITTISTRFRLIGTTQTAKKIPTTSKAKNIMYNLIQSKVEVLSSSTRSKQYNNSFLTDRFNNCLNVVENCGGSMVDYEDTEEEMASLSKLRPMIK